MLGLNGAGKSTLLRILAGVDTEFKGRVAYSPETSVSVLSGGETRRVALCRLLSGGERNRVHLARILKGGYNVLLLNEPTNDLDINTIRALEDGLEEFAGCAVIISHDRWFLDRVATHIMAFEGDSQVICYEGNYGAYEEGRKKRMGVDADQPHRIKYRKLTR